MGDIINLPNGPVAAKKLPDGSFVLKVQNVDDTGTAASSGGGSSLSDTIWTDDTNAYFVRRDSGSAITWTDVSGTASAAPGTGARPASGLTAVIDRASYAANTGGTGFSTGDLIDHIVITDPGSGVVIGNFWINSTTSAKITAPSGAALSAITQQVTVADGANAAEGAKADAAWSGTGSGSVVSILKALWATLTGTVIVGGTVADGVAPTSNAVRVSGVDGGGLKRTFLTDTTGRLSAIIADGADAAEGAKADAAWSGSGSGSIIAILKALWSALTGTLTVNQTVQGSSTDRSGTIAAGGAAQQLMPANSSRRGIWIQNQSNGDLYVYGLGTATLAQPSMLIPSGAMYESPLTHVGTAAISIIGATTGQAFAAREW